MAGNEQWLLVWLLCLLYLYRLKFGISDVVVITVPMMHIATFTSL